MRGTVRKAFAGCNSDIDCVILLDLYYSPLEEVSSKCKMGQADFTDWMLFLPSSLMEEIKPGPEELNVNT